jgi:iron complex transport system substrate-binding protein
MNRLKTTVVALTLFLMGCLLAWVLEDPAATETAVTSPANHIICLSPSIVEIVYALKQDHRIVGISDYCVHPPEAKSKPLVGGYINPNFERILALKPDLIIFQGKHERIDAFCHRKGIPWLQLKMDNFETTFHAIERIGERLGCVEQASTLKNKIEQECDQVKTAVSGRERPRVFLSLFREAGSLVSLTTVGPKTFLHELLEIAGGENIFSDVKQLYPEISKESLLKRKPDIIIEVRPVAQVSAERRSPLTDDWLQLSGLPAVSKQRIYTVRSEDVLFQGPRMGQTALQMARLMFPEAFDE